MADSLVLDALESVLKRRPSISVDTPTSNRERRTQTPPAVSDEARLASQTTVNVKARRKNQSLHLDRGTVNINMDSYKCKYNTKQHLNIEPQWRRRETPERRERHHRLLFLGCYGDNGTTHTQSVTHLETDNRGLYITYHSPSLPSPQHPQSPSAVQNVHSLFSATVVH